MAFQRKKGAEDQIFVLRKILDERWRKGRFTVLLSLDLKQAFDRVDISKAATILSSMGVPNELTNRILKACLTEQTSIQWFSQRTQSITKNKGIKQGCPLSPILFIVMLHSALSTLKEFVPDLQLDHVEEIKLPLILAYADDIMFLCTSESEIEPQILLLEPLLASIGLEINMSKTKVLIRNPYDTNNMDQNISKQFGKYNITVVTKLCYLGTYITSSLTRKEITAERIKKGYKAFHSLCSFLKQHPLQWNTIERLYHSLITPVVTYSMQTSTILKSNRNSLRRMEYTMLTALQGLSTESRNEASQNTTEQNDEFKVDNNQQYIPAKLLGGKTINKKIRIARLNFFGHLLRRDPQNIMTKALKYRISDKKKLGRPCHTWKTSLRQDIERSGLPLKYWKDLANNRTQYKAATRNQLQTMKESEYEDDESIESDNSSDTEMQLSEFEGWSDTDTLYGFDSTESSDTSSVDSE